MVIKIKKFSSILLFLSLFMIYLQIITTATIEKGDKFLTETDDDLSMRNGLIDTKYRWPNGEIPYSIRGVDFTKEQKNLINRVIRTFNNVSCVNIRRKTPSDTYWVVIKGDEPHCKSQVGYQGIHKQFLNFEPSPINTKCFRFGSIAHEFLHTFGFEHMQSTWDRDDYVRIHEENIKEGGEGNFKKFPFTHVTSFGYPYDYDSVMHYAGRAGSKNKMPTIVPIQPTNVTIGQRTHLSVIDIAKLNAMYNCTEYL